MDALLKAHWQTLRWIPPPFSSLCYFFTFEMTFLLIQHLSITVNEAANWDIALDLEVMFLCHPVSQVDIALSICGASWQITLLIFRSAGLFTKRDAVLNTADSSQINSQTTNSSNIKQFTHEQTFTVVCPKRFCILEKLSVGHYYCTGHSKLFQDFLKIHFL